MNKTGVLVVKGSNYSISSDENKQQILLFSEFEAYDNFRKAACGACARHSET